MRVRKKDQKNLIKVGVFVTSLLVVLMVIIASIGKETSLFQPKVAIRARVQNVSNLKTGSYVELKGIRIGSVTAITIISDEEVEVTMTVLRSHLRWIKKDSKVSLSTAGLVGDKYVEIYNGTKGARTLNPDKDILISKDLGDVKSVLSKGESIAEVTDRILNKLDGIMTQLEDGKDIIETIHSLNKASTNLEKISSELKEARIGQMVKSVNTASSSVNRILNRVENGPGTMNALIYDESAHDDLRALLGGAQRNKVIKYFIRESIKKSEQQRQTENE